MPCESVQETLKLSDEATSSPSYTEPPLSDAEASPHSDKTYQSSEESSRQPVDSYADTSPSSDAEIGNTNLQFSHEMPTNNRMKFDQDSEDARAEDQKEIAKFLEELSELQKKNGEIR